jgi:ATP-dependent Clp protease protease subunit
MNKPLIDISSLEDSGARLFAGESRYPSIIRLNADSKASSAELVIYGEIGGWWDGIDAAQTIKDLSALDVDQIDVRLNSPGGVVFDGVAIYNALAQHKANITVNIEGVAASIASVIAMAGDEIRIGEAANVMIHKPWSFAFGDAGEMRKEADVLDTLEAGIIDIYAARTGADRKQLQDWVAAETWFRGQAAIDAGFADSLVPAKAKKASAARSAVYALFKHSPSDLVRHDGGDNLSVREFERLLRDGEGRSNAESKRIASMAARIFAAERDVPAITHREDAKQTATDAELYKLACRIRELSR